MQPLFNLKSFVAVMIILIVPAALLVAYFRNYSAERGGHEHGGAATAGQGSDVSHKADIRIPAKKRNRRLLLGRAATTVWNTAR
jgi:hypothetical protein